MSKGGASKGSGTMSRGAYGRRSVGAAGGGLPNAAILDDTFEVKLGVDDNFRSWAKRYRKKKSLKPNDAADWFGGMTSPIKGK